MDTQDDARMVTRAVAGDAEAFAALLEAYYPMMYRVAFKWCGTKEDAEDVAQEVCLKLSRNIGDFRGDSAFSTWLYRITLNAVRDFQRTRGRHPEGKDAPYDTVAADDATRPDAGVMQRQLWQAVQRLPERQRDAVMLVYSEEKSHAEAAAIMGCAESTVSWYIHEARKQLKVQLGD